MALSISQLTFEHHRAALGIGESQPRISWRFGGTADNWEQATYDIEITRNAGSAPRVFNVNSSESIFVPWPDAPLGSRERASVRVRAHGGDDQVSTPWSDWVAVETGLLGGEWAAVTTIAADRPTERDGPKRPIHFRKAFATKCSSKVVSARLYIAALGLYNAEINGKQVGDSVLAAGWQSYNFRHVYNTYDVTGHVRNGRNAIGVIVGEGWYSGRLLGFAGSQRNLYGDTLGLLSLLVVTYADGTTLEIPTDTSWQAQTGPVLTSQIYDGEVYDSRLEAGIEGWSTARFDASGWLAVKAITAPKGRLTPPDGPPVRRIEERKPERIFKSPSGRTIIDFGQNLVGWMKLTVKGPAGTNVIAHHAEVLENGELALRPLRSAVARDTITLHGNGTQTWEPHFTFHGFRYGQIEGWPEETPVDEHSITAVVIHTDMERTGWFECSHPLLNRFHENVRWSMRGNFVSIPTDCPQRDERLGWTGDAHVFGPTSNYIYNAAGLWRSWHKDVWSEMGRHASPVPPHFVPAIPPDVGADPRAVWGDVVVASPWNLFRAFGDLGMLQEQYPQAQAWIDRGIPRNEVGLWNRNTGQYGDWLDPLSPPEDPGRAQTPPHLVADAYLVAMTARLASISQALGETEAAARYLGQFDSLRDEFRKAWVVNGKMASRSQTAYALALDFDLLRNASDVAVAASTLREIVSQNDYRVGTGFSGTPSLGPALRRIGATGDFYRMLLQTETPSWLYHVTMNGTTTWERWDSLLPNGNVNPGSMTSFNHYAFGSVADWIHKNIGGIGPSEPGWKKVDVKPVPGGGITNADARHISPYGEVRSKWWFASDGFRLNVWVPPNSKATVTMPNGGETKEVGSGFYEFHDPAYVEP